MITTNIKYTLKDWKLVGKVKSLKEDSYHAVEKAGKIIKGDKIRWFLDSDKHVFFNKSGNETEINYLMPEDIECDKTKREYDDNDKIKTTSDFYCGKLSYKTVFMYNKKGLLRKTKSYLSPNIISSSDTYKYNNSGFLIEQIHKHSDKGYNKRYVMKYTDDGKLINKVTYDKDGIFSEECKYMYDNIGNIVQKEEYLEYYFSTIETNYVYDNNGDVIEEEVFDDGVQRNKTTYNKQYKFDKQNNWIRRIDTENDKPVRILYREIEYYSYED